MRSVQDIRNMPEFSIYVDYMRKVLGELLGWSQEKVDALVADYLENSGCREYFMHDPWSEDVAWRIIRERIPEQLEDLAGKPVLSLVRRLAHAIDPSPSLFNIHLHQDVHYDWRAARDRIEEILKESAKAE